MIFADTHVHIHRCFDLEIFLSSAVSNFRSAAAASCPGQSYKAVLCLTEDAGAGMFDHIWKLACGHSGLSGWSISRTREQHSVIASHHEQGELIILAGRQIRCGEGLEVLALGTRHSFNDGIALDAAIEKVQGKAAVAILPWGFGKWTGRRGRLVRRILESRTPEDIFLGDNSGRLACWPEPREFTLARQRGFRILPGSDPLPFSSEVTRVASYGLSVPGDLSSTEPARDMIGILLDPSVQHSPFGRLESPLGFLRHQVGMQRVKRQRVKRQMESSRA